MLLSRPDEVLLCAVKQVQIVLGGGSSCWTKYVNSASGSTAPSHHHLLVFISEVPSEMEEAANAAALCGYDHVAVLQGNVAQIEEAAQTQASILHVCCKSRTAHLHIELRMFYARIS